MKLTTKHRGIVLSVQADSFWARLESSSDQPDEECEFKIDVISSDERKLIVPGAGFTFVIEQSLHFDPLEKYSAENIERARELAKKWESVLEGPKNSSKK